MEQKSRLIISCILCKSTSAKTLNALRKLFVECFGEIAEILPLMKMSNLPTSYVQELGSDLFTIIYIFKGKFSLNTFINIKKIAMSLESNYVIRKRRKFNINPGFIDSNGIFLLSHKARRRRTFIGEGVWFEQQLVSNNGALLPLSYTFTEFLEQTRINRFAKYVFEVKRKVEVSRNLSDSRGYFAI